MKKYEAKAPPSCKWGHNLHKPQLPIYTAICRDYHPLYNWWGPTLYPCLDVVFTNLFDLRICGLLRTLLVTRYNSRKVGLKVEELRNSKSCCFVTEMLDDATPTRFIMAPYFPPPNLGVAIAIYFHYGVSQQVLNKSIFQFGFPSVFEGPSSGWAPGQFAVRRGIKHTTLLY